LAYFSPDFKTGIQDMNASTNRCPLCGGAKETGKNTCTADLGFGVIVVRNVPAQVCTLCGEDWIEDTVAEKLEKIVEEARITQPIIEVAHWKEKAAA
jgi:YgiT-type zinc finger domain-containing protein